MTLFVYRKFCIYCKITLLYLYVGTNVQINEKKVIDFHLVTMLLTT